MRELITSRLCQAAGSSSAASAKANSTAATAGSMNAAKAKISTRHGEGHHELRQILPEIGFELLDSIDERKRECAGALTPGIGRPERGDAVEQHPPEPLLDERRRPVRDNGPPVLAGPAHDHDARDADNRPGQFGGRSTGEYAPDQPAEQRQPRHTQRRRQQPDRH